MANRPLYSAITAAVSRQMLVLCWVAILTLATPSWAGPAPSLVARTSTPAVLHFPKDRAVGKLFLLSLAGSREFYNEKAYAMAQGDVKIDPGAIYLLAVNFDGARDFGYLKAMPPGVIAGLRMEKLGITDEQFLSLPDLSALKVLHLKDVEITDRGIMRIKECKQLVGLAIGGSRITGKGLAVLRGLSHVSDLDLDHNVFSDASMADIATIKGLTRLRLRATNIGDAGIAELKGLGELRKLNICSNRRITDASIPYLLQMKRLKHLDITDCKVTGKGLLQLKEARNLQFLTVAYRDLGVGQLDMLHRALPKCEINDGHKSMVPLEVFSPLH
jgi:hypothetical protein